MSRSDALNLSIGPLGSLVLETSDGAVDGLEDLGRGGSAVRTTSDIGLEDLGQARLKTLQTTPMKVVLVDHETVGGIALSTSVDAAEAHEGSAFDAGDALVPHDLVESITEGVGSMDDVLGWEC